MDQAGTKVGLFYIFARLENHPAKRGETPGSDWQGGQDKQGDISNHPGGKGKETRKHKKFPDPVPPPGKKKERYGEDGKGIIGPEAGAGIKWIDKVKIQMPGGGEFADILSERIFTSHAREEGEGEENAAMEIRINETYNYGRAAPEGKAAIHPAFFQKIADKKGTQQDPAEDKKPLHVHPQEMNNR